MKKSNVLVLTECSIMIALSAVLSIIPIFEMPYGGSITLASFLPIVIVAYRHGIKCGLATAGASSLVQMAAGSTLTMFPRSIMSAWALPQ